MANFLVARTAIKEVLRYFAVGNFLVNGYEPGNWIVAIVIFVASLDAKINNAIKFHLKM